MSPLLPHPRVQLIASRGVHCLGPIEPNGFGGDARFAGAGLTHLEIVDLQRFGTAELVNVN